MVDSIEFGMDSSYLALHCGARGSSEPAFPSSSVLSLDALRIDQQITIRHVDRLLHGPQQGRYERTPQRSHVREALFTVQRQRVRHPAGDRERQIRTKFAQARADTGGR